MEKPDKEPSTGHDDGLMPFMRLMEQAARFAGLETRVDGDRVVIHASDAPEEYTETITIRRDIHGVPRWYWSWDEVILPAAQVDDVVERVSRVVRIIQDATLDDDDRSGGEPAREDTAATGPIQHVPFTMFADARGQQGGVSWANPSNGVATNSGPGYWGS